MAMTLIRLKHERQWRCCLCLLLWFAAGGAPVFVEGFLHHHHRSFSASLPRSSCRAINPRGADVVGDDKARDQLQRLSLTESVLQLDEGDYLIPIHLVGKAIFPRENSSLEQQTGIDCAVLSRSSREDSDVSPEEACLFLPLQPSNRLRLLQRLCSLSSLSSSIAPESSRRMTRLELLGWNANIVNRDSGIFDNLPYAAWSGAEQDAAGRAISPKFHLGKRECYNRMMGKDWYRDRILRNDVDRSVDHDGENSSDNQEEEEESGATPVLNLLVEQVQNLLNRNSNRDDKQNQKSSENDEGEIIEYDDFADLLLGSSEAVTATPTTPTGKANNDDDFTTRALTLRILELQLRECQMEVAECDSQIAQSTTTTTDRGTTGDDPSLADGGAAEEWQRKREDRLNKLQEIQDRLDQLQDSSENGNSLASSIFFDLFPPDSKSTDTQSSSNISDNAMSGPSSYASPYAMLQEIIAQQMNAQVVAAVLENASLLENTVTVSGLIVLQRIPETITLQGERVRVPSQKTILVECDADEAIGMSLSSENIPLWIEKNVWEQGSLMAQRDKNSPTQSDDDALDTWTTLDPEISVLIEGQAGNQSATERVLPVRIQRGEPSLYDRLVSQQQQQQQEPVNLFPVDNPVTSLQQLDEMSIDDKTRTLMSMSNFNGRLPRPRVLRSSTTALDNLLLPLIDETVRTQYQIREATQRGDLELVRQLETSKSERAQAKERAEEARQSGDEALAEQYEEEAEFLESLRADITQDEGAYSRFLDRDDWYERDRQRLAKRVDKSKFGNSLDNIE